MPDTPTRPRSNVIRSRTDAAMHVRKIAIELLADLRSSAASPTLRDTRERLDTICRKTHELRKLLAAASGPHGLLQRVAMECGFFRRTLTENGPRYDLVGEDEILARPLQLLAEVAGRHRFELDDPTLSGPGRERLHERLSGDPRLHLGWSCTLLLKECRGNANTDPSTGSVLELMQKVWAYAVGDEPPVDVLLHAAETGAKLVRQGAAPPRLDRFRIQELIGPKSDDWSSDQSSKESSIDL
jgi:hypothetical protein